MSFVCFLYVVAIDAVVEFSYFVMSSVVSVSVAVTAIITVVLLAANYTQDGLPRFSPWV